MTVTAGKLAQFSEVRAGGSYLSQNDPRLHFGLGAEVKMSEVEIRWPSGKVEVLRDVPADFIYTIVEGQGIESKLPLPRRHHSGSSIFPKSAVAPAFLSLRSGTTSGGGSPIVLAPWLSPDRPR